MTNVDFTTQYHVHSSALDDVYYNANTKTAVVVTSSGYVYSYADVPQEAVSRLVNSSSVGRTYNLDFKGKFKSNYLGYENRVDFRKVTPVRTGPVTPQALTPVARPGQINITGTANTTTATAVSIQEIPRPQAVSTDAPTYTIVFNGGKEFTVDGAVDQTDALVKFNKIAGAFVDALSIEKLVIDFTGGNS